MSILKPDFMKEGPGVGKDISSDPGFIRFFKTLWNRIGQIVILNLVYVFACLPIVTIGPATAGLTYVMRNFSQSKPVFFMSDFLEKCKSCFVNGLLVTVVDAVAAVAFYFSFNFWSDGSNGIPSTFRPLALVITFIVAYLIICMNFYIFPMMVSFDLPFGKLVKNSLILAMYKIFHNLAMIVFDAVLIALCLIFMPITVPAVMCLLFSIVNLFNNFIVYPLLVKYVATPKEEAVYDETEQIFNDNRKLK